MEGKEDMYRNNRNGYRMPPNASGYNPNFQPPSNNNRYPNSNYRNDGYQEYYNNDYSMNPDDFYGGYDRNAYIVDGNEYLGDDFKYANQINNEYYYQNNSRRGNMRYDERRKQNQKDYYQPKPNGYRPQQQYDQMIDNMSAGINNGLTDEMNFDYTVPLYPEEAGKKPKEQNYENRRMAYGYGGYGDRRYDINSGYFDEEEDDGIMSMSDLFNLIICVVLALVLARLITLYVAQHTEVDGHSMNFNLKNQDILVIDKISYRFKDPQRFDIVIFPVKSGSFYVKRLIGLPGETVKVTSVQKTECNENEKPSTIYINGKPLEENYGFDDYLKWGTKNEEIKLGKDEYFVMGDNRNDSRDSRDRENVGNVKRVNLVGKAVFRIYPFKSIGTIDNTINKQIKVDDKYELGKDGDTVVNPNEQIKNINKQGNDSQGNADANNNQPDSNLPNNDQGNGQNNGNNNDPDNAGGANGNGDGDANGNGADSPPADNQ